MMNDEERIYKMGDQLDIPKKCIANTIKEIRSWCACGDTKRCSDNEVATELKIALRKIQINDKLNGASIECPYCQPKDGVDDVVLVNVFTHSSINAKKKIIEYDGGNGDTIHIHFCPFCGRKL